METPTYYAGLYIENNRATYDKYRAAADELLDNGLDFDETSARVAVMMKNDFVSTEAVAEQTAKLPDPYADILKAGLAQVD